MKKKHTPGPWTVQGGAGAPMHVFAADPRGCVADGDLVTVADLIDDPDDARLIAAAPDLLAALKKAIDPLDLYHAYGWPDRSRVRDEIRAAIKKAEA